MSMSRYYFNVHDGVNFILDDDGFEFDSLASAERAAALTASELEADRVRKGNAAGHEVAVEVRDEDHQPVAMVTFGMRIYRWPPPPQSSNSWGASNFEKTLYGPTLSEADLIQGE